MSLLYIGMPIWSLRISIKMVNYEHFSEIMQTQCHYCFWQIERWIGYFRLICGLVRALSTEWDMENWTFIMLCLNGISRFILHYGSTQSNTSRMLVLSDQHIRRGFYYLFCQSGTGSGKLLVNIFFVCYVSLIFPQIFKHRVLPIGIA